LVPGGESIILIGIEVRLGEISGSMNLCIPLLVFNPVLVKLSSQAQFKPKMSAQIAQTVYAIIRERLSDAQVKMQVDLGTTELMVSELLDIQPGDVITLDHKTEEPVMIQVEGHPKFLAKQGCIGQKLGLQVVQSLEQ